MRIFLKSEGNMTGVKTDLNVVELAKVVLSFVDGLSVFSLFTESIF